LSASFVRENPALTFLYQQIQGLNPARGEDGIISGFRREDGPQVEAFANWSIPTLLIVGQEDAIFPPEVIAEVQKVIPGSRMEVVPGAAHSAHFEQAAVFNGYLSELFSGVLSGSVAGAAAD
jgi:3-oxoadipate enol-lactonase